MYDVTEEPSTSEEQVYAFTAAAAARHDDANGGGMSDNVFTVDTNQPHVTEVRIESDVCDDGPDFKAMYRKLKREYRSTIETNEYVKSELRHCQRVLQSVEEDKYFLLERLLQYGDPPDSSNSESESEAETGSPGKGDRNPSGIVINSAFSKLRSFTAERKGRKRAKLDTSADDNLDDVLQDDETLHNQSIEEMNDENLDENLQDDSIEDLNDGSVEALNDGCMDGLVDDYEGEDGEEYVGGEAASAKEDPDNSE